MSIPLDVDAPARLVAIPTAQTMLGGVARSYVYELLARGELEAVSLGRRRMIVVSSIDAYIGRLRGAR